MGTCHIGSCACAMLCCANDLWTRAAPWSGRADASSQAAGSVEACSVQLAAETKGSPLRSVSAVAAPPAVDASLPAAEQQQEAGQAEAQPRRLATPVGEKAHEKLAVPFQPVTLVCKDLRYYVPGGLLLLGAQGGVVVTEHVVTQVVAEPILSVMPKWRIAQLAHDGIALHDSCPACPCRPQPRRGGGCGEGRRGGQGGCGQAGAAQRCDG